MFGLSIVEILVILVVALIFLGPERLPGIARTLGKTLAEFRRTMDELKYDFNSVEEDLRNVSPRNLIVADLGPDAEKPNCEQREKAPEQPASKPADPETPST